ncbi:MAG: glycosyltransferase family 1 protein [Blastocatellia bacterium]
MPPLRVAIICDLREEGWPSMDFVAETLFANLQRYQSMVSVTKLQPSMKRRFSRLPLIGKTRFATNGDRLINRFLDYPRYLRLFKNNFDVFHMVDHSYSHLVHELPPERTIITCHDLDTFRCLLEPDREPRGWAFKAMTKRILDGFEKAATVVCVSHATRDRLLEHKLVQSKRIAVIRNGVDSACSPEPDSESEIEAERYLGSARHDSVDLLHVGSTICRKRIDVLLRVFAAVKKRVPSARLIRAGASLNASQTALAESLGVTDSLIQLPFLNKQVLSAVYRRAALLLQPSDDEGFGLPVVEAMACATPAVASDIPALREVGGEASVYCPVAEIDQWTETVVSLLNERSANPESWELRRQRCVTQAAQFDWVESTRMHVELYKEVATGSLLIVP